MYILKNYEINICTKTHNNTNINIALHLRNAIDNSNVGISIKGYRTHSVPLLSNVLADLEVLIDDLETLLNGEQFFYSIEYPSREIDRLLIYSPSAEFYLELEGKEII